MFRISSDLIPLIFTMFTTAIAQEQPYMKFSGKFSLDFSNPASQANP